MRINMIYGSAYDYMSRNGEWQCLLSIDTILLQLYVHVNIKQKYGSVPTPPTEID